MDQEDGISSTAKEAWRLPGLSMLQQKEAYNMWKTTAHDYDELHAPAPLTANELMLKRLAEPAFQLRQTKITDDLTLSGLPNFSGGKLFEDPVTLETGQTFERMAIKEWFNQGKRTCPVTGKSLDYSSLPHTNVILKHNARVAALLSCCIEADSVCRYQIARDINKQCLFELVCSEQVSSRTNAVMLLTELICLSRRKDVPLLVSDLQDEEITNIMYSIHDYLQNSPLVRRPLVATLLLNIDLLVDPKKYGLYRNQAVDAITEALDSSLIDEEVREKCCRALLILGGRFSLSGKLLTEDCILKVAGFKDDHEANSIKKEADLYFDDSSGKGDLVTACLATVAWLTGVLPSPTDDTELQQTLCTLISQLKQNLESGAQVQHKFIASMSLLNLKPRIQGPANDDCRRYGESSKKPY
ncbi:putative E3 ubiquitin-protein ligase LIN-1 [Hibiscus syriacus]|uniref:putative E3 ubiquitin-protein ligase LIN-1 n=1 Tax=Hibiscus syriacus TaxID=106335 RepID=UPI00192462B0|nr:putative E3 ubiquitin-protein ligase LIN-1 [Hibiscus syriacus]